MSTTIKGVTTTTVHTLLLMLGYEATRRGRNVIHELADSNAPAVVLRTAGLRSGTIKALCATSAAALALETDLKTAQKLEFATTDLTGINMTFVLLNELTVELEDDTRKLFIVTFDFQEITP